MGQTVRTGEQAGASGTTMQETREKTTSPRLEDTVRNQIAASKPECMAARDSNLAFHSCWGASFNRAFSWRLYTAETGNACKVPFRNNSVKQRRIHSSHDLCHDSGGKQHLLYLHARGFIYSHMRGCQIQIREVRVMNSFIPVMTLHNSTGVARCQSD